MKNKTSIGRASTNTPDKEISLTVAHGYVSYVDDDEFRLETEDHRAVYIFIAEGASDKLSVGDVVHVRAKVMGVDEVEKAIIDEIWSQDDCIDVHGVPYSSSLYRRISALPSAVQDGYNDRLLAVLNANRKTIISALEAEDDGIY